MTKAAGFLFFACCAFALAYNPPVDTAGPLTLQIHEPALGSYGAGGLLQLTSPDLPIPIRISLTNAGNSVLLVRLRLGLTGGWTALPAGETQFRVEPRKESEVELVVKQAPGSFNAHYPVHAYAEFEDGGRKFIAHAILILETRYPDPPHAYLPLEWKPVAVAPDSALALERLPVHRESAEISSDGRVLAGGAAGEQFEASGPVRTAGDAIRMQLGPRAPSKREIVKSAAVEFPLRLPPGPVRFESGCNGAATFRVSVSPLGEEKPGAAYAEQGCGKGIQADLSRYAGQAIRLKLESASASTGTATWTKPTIVAGRTPAPAPFPPASNEGSRVIGKAGDYEVRMWPGRRGLLDAAVGFVSGERKLFFRGFRVEVLGDALEAARAASALTGVTEEMAGTSYRLRHHFESAAGPFDVVGELSVADGALRARWRLENGPQPRPWFVVRLEGVRTGSWSDDAERVYAGPGNVIERPAAFRLGFDGHSNATSFVGFDFANGVSVVQASDVSPDALEVDPRTNTYTLAVPHAQTIAFFPGPVWDGVRLWRSQNGLKPSAGVPKLAGRFVFDLWDWKTGYSESAAALNRAFRYGLTDAAVVWHNWQRWGYDYRLPDVYPPNPQAGTVEDFRRIAAACKGAGVLFAPHDNYIDFYPDADGFTYDDIVFRNDGSPYRAWFHAARGAQSYRFRPDRVRPFVERNMRLIKESVAPDAYFIDVWSSMGPYDFWTSDGTFHERSETRRAWGETFAWIRDYLGDAPQISEAGHDQLIGWLDGAQAQVLRVDPKASGFTWRIEAKDAERIPWFDAAHHDRFVLHGAGYSDRYAGGLDEREHGIYSDDYIATEVLTGHPAMVADAFSCDVVRKYWLLHDMMQALGSTRIAAVEFAAGDIHRQHITWENGAEVFVNRGAGEWTVAGHSLPQYGFHARTKDGAIEAAIERRGPGTIEWARSPENLYLNTRGVQAGVDGLELNGGVRLRREGKVLAITPLPESGPIEIAFDQSKLADVTSVEAVSEDASVLRRLTPVREGRKIRLATEAGVFEYRLR